MTENLINDLLDLAKIENNSFSLTQEYFDLTKIIYEAFNMMVHMTKDSNIKMQADIDNKRNLALIR